MNVLKKSTVEEFIRDHPDSEKNLLTWYKNARRAAWSSLHEVREQYPHADAVGECVVFNISGNKYRLVTKIVYAEKPTPDGKYPFRGRVYIRAILSHAEYDEGKWKTDCGC